MPRESFGGRLRAERERAGVSLDAIVQITKIQRSLLVGLENNDVSHWPSGIFRRAFFREYLAAIGIRSEAVVTEFVRLFPESGEAVPDVAAVGGLDGGDMRLQLADAPNAKAQRWLLQAAAAGVDLAAVFVLAAWAIVLLGLQVWPTTAAVGLFYYGVSVAWLGLTPGLWWFFGDRSAFRGRAARKSAIEVPALRIVARQPDQPEAHAETHVA